MKKLLLTVTLCLACAAAFAQGKVRLVNDSLHLVYFTSDATRLMLGDGGLTNQAYVLGAGSAAQVLTIQLWAGTSSTALSLAATTSFAGQGSPGTWAGANVTLASAAGPTFFQIQVFDVAEGSYDAARLSQNHYYGETGIFTANSSSTAAYFSLVQHISPAFSTWTDGTTPVLGNVAGAMGGIELVANVPEPTTMALAGLAGAALMIFRRRK